MQRILFFSLTLGLLVSSCIQDPDPASITPEDTPVTAPTLSKTEINAAVEAHLFATNDVFHWEDADDHFVWSALSVSEREAVLGYQPAGYRNLRETIHEINVNEGEWKATRDRLVADLLEASSRLTGTAVTEEDLFHDTEDGVLPILEVRVLHPEILTEFRNREEVRYLEPSNYTPGEVTLRSGSGCGEAGSSNLNSGDYTTIAPGGKQGWNLAYHNIPTAWNTSTGDNIGICVIDSGTYPEQSRLNGTFSSGYSTGRYVNRYGTYRPSMWSSRLDGPDDQCGHGTQMAGIATAPRVGGGSSVGVAYEANLVSVRATSDVIVNNSREKRGVKDALVLAGNRSDVKIVSMSIGDVFSSGTVRDGIYYAYNRGKLIVAAAGTSLTWTSWWGVIFPASMNETTAATGIQTGLPTQRCDNCHDGDKVDFTVIMQRRNDTDRLALTLSRSGNTPGYVGGSSAATATTAGIAALVWATNPGQSRSQVLNRMKQAASNYPGRDGNFGWGNIDAAQAVQ